MNEQQKGPPIAGLLHKIPLAVAAASTAGVTAPAARMPSPRKSGVVLAASVMRWSTWGAVLIVRRVCTKTVEGVLPPFWHRSMVALARIVALVDVAIKAMMPMEPGAGPDEYSSSEPIRTVVAIRGTVIRSIREVAVGAHRSHPDVDRHLRRCA
jgi:hypothetical protein